MKKFLRWLLVPLSVIAVWYATLLLGLVGFSALDYFCPPEHIVSGACTAPWHAPAIDALLLVCTAIASFGIVIVPALVAPLQRFRVALAAFGCGAVFAIYVASSGGFWPPFVVSAAGGSAGLWVAASQLKPSGIAM